MGSEPTDSVPPENRIDKEDRQLGDLEVVDRAGGIRRLLTYTLWADAVLLSALQEVSPEHLALSAGTSFGSLQGTMAHILGAEQTWLSRFLGRSLGYSLENVPGIAEYPDLETLLAGFAELRAELEVFVASLDKVALARDLEWENSRGERFRMPLWAPIQHMVNHSSYHRGQLVTLLRQMGYPAPSTDLIYFLVDQLGGRLPSEGDDDS